MVHKAKTHLAKQFPVTDLGTAHFFLGIAIKRNHDINLMTLCQSLYIQKVVERYNVVEAHTASTPLNPGIEGNPSRVDDEEVEETVYRSMIGNLMYLILCPRPDIAFVVGALS